MLRLLATLAALLLLAAGCGEGGSASDAARDATGGPESPPFRKDGSLAFVRGADTLSTIDVEIAEEDSARARGLMQRASLPAGSGMLFLFGEDEVEEQSFYMANTPMALDILFAGPDSQIVRVAKNTTPYSTELVKSGAPAQFVVEVPAGYADRRGIVEGDRIRFRRTDGAGGNARGSNVSETGAEADAAPDSLAPEPFEARLRSSSNGSS